MKISSSAPVLITGADGFVGWHVLEHLKQAGWSEIHVTSRAGSDRLSQAAGAEKLHVLDLTDISALTKLLQQVQPAAIIHFAAWSAVNGSFPNAQKILRLNNDLQLAMLEAMRQACPQARLLSIGSGHGYGQILPPLDPWKVAEDYPFNPDNPYAVSKISQEMLSRAYTNAFKLDVVFVRPFNQIGPGQSTEFAVPSFAQQIVQVERGEATAVQVGNLSAVRDFTDVRDAARAYELLLTSAESGQTYNLGSGVGVTMQHVLDTLISLSTTPQTVVVDPNRLRPSDIPVFVANSDRLRSLGWEPSHSLETTLRAILMEARQQT